MRRAFATAPGAIKTAVIFTTLYPSVIAILMFKLYVRPANSSAYELIALLTVPYSVAALLLLKRVKVVRWLVVAWVVFGIIRAIVLELRVSTVYWDIFWIVVLGWILQLFVVALLFSSQGNRHFENKPA